MSEMTKNILELLSELDRLVDDVKPIEQPQRFGNQAFRTWYKILQEVRFRPYFYQLFLIYKIYRFCIYYKIFIFRML